MVCREILQRVPASWSGLHGAMSSPVETPDWAASPGVTAMTFAEELKGIIGLEGYFGPDDIDWFEHVCNDEEEIAATADLFNHVFKKSYSEVCDFAEENDIDPEDQGQLLVVEAGRRATRALLAFAYLAGVVSQRQANSTLLEQLGGHDGGGDSG